MRVCTNLLIFVTLAGTSYAIYLAVDNAEAKVHRRDFHEAFNSGTQGLVLFLASFQVSTSVISNSVQLSTFVSNIEASQGQLKRVVLGGIQTHDTAV